MSPVQSVSYVPGPYPVDPPPPSPPAFDSKILLGKRLRFESGYGFDLRLIGFGRMGRGGRLEALEEQGAALGIEGIVRDANGDLGEGDLDGTEVDEHGEGKRRRCCDARPASRGTRGMVVVAELLAAEGQGAAAAAGGVEVLAGGGGFRHDVLPLRLAIRS